MISFSDLSTSVVVIRLFRSFCNGVYSARVGMAVLRVPARGIVFGRSPLWVQSCIAKSMLQHERFSFLRVALDLQLPYVSMFMGIHSSVISVSTLVRV